MRRYGNRLVSVTVNVDVAPFLRMLDAAARDSARALDTMAQSVKRMGEVFARAREVQVSGLEARVYVMAGLDPAINTEARLHWLVRVLLRKPSAVLGLGDSMFLTRHDRARLAAAALRGWVMHRQPEPEWRHPEAPEPVDTPLPWHRYMAGTRVQVV